jgi:hypothetical protein
MVTRAPRVSALVTDLQNARHPIGAKQKVTLRFSRGTLEETRQEFAEAIRDGEERLHHLCGLMARVLLRGHYELSSIVIAEMPGTGENFTLRQKMSRSDLYSGTDLDLGHRLLERVKLNTEDGWQHPRLVANFVEYQPMTMDDFRIHKMISRIKAEEEIWNKVVYEIFELDKVVKRDKELSQYSRYVKDIFGIKIVVGQMADVHPLQLALEELRFSPGALRAEGVPHEASTEQPRILEVKSYLAARKKSGWKALKSVVVWWGQTFEIQIQPLANYFLEQEYLTRESHSAFKKRRDRIYQAVGESDRVFAFYRELLQWLFRKRAEGPAPELRGVQIVIEA